MKKFEKLGRVLSKTDQMKIYGGNDEEEEDGPCTCVDSECSAKSGPGKTCKCADRPCGCKCVCVTIS